MRRFCYLPSLKDTGRFPRRVLLLDTETEVFRVNRKAEYHRFRLGVTCFLRYDENGSVKHEEWKGFTDRAQMCSYIESCTRRDQSLYVLASNVHFDLWILGFYSHLLHRGYRLVGLWSCDLSFGAIVKKKRRRIVCLSLQNFLPTSMRAWGKEIGMEVYDVDFKTCSTRELQAHCVRDVELLKSAWSTYLDFVRSHRLGNFSLTLPAQAFTAFRTHYLKRKVLVHNHKHLLELERAAYFGGRVEVRRLGYQPGPILHLDVNSLYPYVMRDKSYPLKPVNFLQEPEIDLAKRFLSNHCLVADCLISSTLPLYPVRHGKNVYLPVGTFRTTLCTESIKRALEYGHLKRIFSCAVYTKGTLFKEYVDNLWRAKEKYKREGKEIQRRMVKLFLNALYGKFGQKVPRITKIEYNEKAPPYRYVGLNAEKKVPATETSLMGRVWVEEGQEEATYSIPAVAAHVTDYGRWVLWDYIEKIGYSNLIYCDTDSIWVKRSDLGLNVLTLTEGKLGGLEKREEVPWLYIYGIRTYDTPRERKAAGLRRDSIKTDVGQYLVEAWPSLWSTLGQVPEGVYPVFRQLRVHKVSYKRGIVKKKGIVEPPVWSVNVSPEGVVSNVPDPLLVGASYHAKALLQPSEGSASA